MRGGVLEVRFRAGLLMGCLLALPGTTRAFTGETMCYAPEPGFDEGESFDEAMCAPGQPHLLRMPSLDLCAPVSGKATADEAYVVAERALQRGRELEAQGRYDEALLHYRVMEASLPRIRDYAAMLRAELHQKAGDPARAAKAYREAMDASVQVDLVAELHVEWVRNLLAAGDKNAEKELEALLRRYPHLPEAPLLKLDLGRFRETQGALRTAAATYRMLDLTLPGYPVAAEARKRLEALAQQGVNLGAYTLDERFARAEHLVRSGPVEYARQVLTELAGEKLAKVKQQKLEAMQQNLLRVDASATFSPAAVAAAEQAVPSADAEAAKKRVLALLGKKTKLEKQKPFQLLSVLHAASREHVPEIADQMVLELARRGASAPADARFDALAIAPGTASDLTLVTLADTLVEHPSLGAAARYHRGRALERAGRLDEARRDFELVQAQDRSVTRFYANWAEQRARALSGASPSCGANGNLTVCAGGPKPDAVRELEAALPPNVSEAIAILSKVELAHGAAFPWFARALDLTRIGELDAAADELHEAYLAYRSAVGRGSLRAGREAVYRGASVVRPSPDAATRRARMGLTMATREELAKASSILGDYGTAAFFGGPRWAESHPHPYPREVAEAARRHNVDPDLLFAVMRVESVYQRRIISYAGAVGLMQIMPRTGRLIADRLGQQDRTTADLLDPETNVNYAAWYLRSLLDRMDGHLPLAIASYNGGPHNVRKWIRSVGDHVPLDAFLERIPFTQTKRYVRRVLGYYVEYKALRGQKVDLMAVSLPRERTSDITF